jgi:hypothetical protein
VQVDESLEKLKDEMALAIASGKTNILQCQDVFEGLTPKVRPAMLLAIVVLGRFCVTAAGQPGGYALARVCKAE